MIITNLNTPIAIQHDLGKLLVLIYFRVGDIMFKVNIAKRSFISHLWPLVPFLVREIYFAPQSYACFSISLLLIASLSAYYKSLSLFLSIIVQISFGSLIMKLSFGEGNALAVIFYTLEILSAINNAAMLLGLFVTHFLVIPLICIVLIIAQILNGLHSFLLE
ncbi:hypothetical protein ACJX0J_029483 [Zea mays]